MDEIFLDCGYVETMTFLCTIIILKVGPLNYNIFKKYIFYIVSFFENWHYKPKINIIDPNWKFLYDVSSLWILSHMVSLF